MSAELWLHYPPKHNQDECGQLDHRPNCGFQLRLDPDVLMEEIAKAVHWPLRMSAHDDSVNGEDIARVVLGVLFPDA